MSDPEMQLRGALSSPALAGGVLPGEVAREGGQALADAGTEVAGGAEGCAGGGEQTQPASAGRGPRTPRSARAGSATETPLGARRLLHFPSRVFAAGARVVVAVFHVRSRPGRGPAAGSWCRQDSRPGPRAGRGWAGLGRAGTAAPQQVRALLRCASGTRAHAQSQSPLPTRSQPHTTASLSNDPPLFLNPALQG